MTVTLQEADVHSVAEWLRCDPSQVAISPCWAPIQQHREAIDNMLASYEYLPKERQRTDQILGLLESGSPLQPVFIAAGDPDRFVMEGRHRLVAFHEAGLRYIPVALASKTSPEQNLISTAPQASLTWPTPPLAVDAILKSEDGERITRVDVTEWFITAPDKELFSLEKKGWRPFSATEKIARKLAVTCKAMTEALEYIVGHDGDDFKVLIMGEGAARFCQDRRSRRSADAAIDGLSGIEAEASTPIATLPKRSTGLSL